MPDDQCRATTSTGFGVATCYLRAGHKDQHDDGQYHWPNVQPLHTRSREAQWAERMQAAGGMRDELILQLFERIETLEQGTAGGAATDDMFAAQERRIVQLEERVRDLERQLSRLPQTYDFSALQANLTTHTNRAMTELGSGLISRWTEQHEQTAERLGAMWNVLAAMAPVIDRMDQAYKRSMAHSQDPITHVELGLDYPEDGAQTERASGSPAAVRCPERFREGQCLGYAGHDGECSAAPGGEQLEDLEECGNPPVPGSASPPCGRPAGHTGVCVSGPQPREDSPYPYAATYDRSSDGTPLEEF